MVKYFSAYPEEVYTQPFCRFCSISRTRGCPEFNVTGKEPSEEIVNFSVGFNTFFKVSPGSYGELLIVILTVVTCVVTITSIFPFEKA